MLVFLNAGEGETHLSAPVADALLGLCVAADAGDAQNVNAYLLHISTHYWEEVAYWFGGIHRAPDAPVTTRGRIETNTVDGLRQNTRERKQNHARDVPSRDGSVAVAALPDTLAPHTASDAVAANAEGANAAPRSADSALVGHARHAVTLGGDAVASARTRRPSTPCVRRDVLRRRSPPTPCRPYRPYRCINSRRALFASVTAHA